MIRIKTKINNDKVYTIFINGQWNIISTVDGKTSSITTSILRAAADVHLDECIRIRNNQIAIQNKALDTAFQSYDPFENIDDIPF